MSVSTANPLAALKPPPWFSPHHQVACIVLSFLRRWPASTLWVGIIPGTREEWRVQQKAWARCLRQVNSASGRFVRLRQPDYAVRIIATVPFLDAAPVDYFDCCRDALALIKNTPSGRNCLMTFSQGAHAHEGVLGKRGTFSWDADIEQWSRQNGLGNFCFLPIDSRMMVMPMYFFADLRCTVFPWIDPAPAGLWVKLRSGGDPRPAWLLTPLTYARVFTKVARLEDLHAAGQYPDEDMAVVYGRWALIHAYATERWSAPDLDAARAAYNANPNAYRLAEPPPQPQDVFSDVPASPGIRYNGSTGKWECPAEQQHAEEAIQ